MNIRHEGREGSITCSTLSEIDPTHPCVIEIGNLVKLIGPWGTDHVEVIVGSGATLTLTWQEIKALESALNLIAHVVTRTGDY